MPIESLSMLFATVLGVSLGTERLVTIVKSVFPGLGKEQRNDAGQPDPAGDRVRRVAVQVVAFVAAWVTAAFLASGGKFDLFGGVTVAGANALAIPVPLLGLLATGGSAFWTSAISYVSHVKDIAAEQRTAHRLDNRAKAKKEGVKYDG